MSKNQKRWSVNEELVLRRMRDEGSTIKEIAKELGRSKYSVANKAFQMINSCTIKKKGNISSKVHKNLPKNFVYSLGTIPNSSRITNSNSKVTASKSKIDYDEVARRVENGGIRNIQKTLREYAKEVGLSVSTLHSAYYNESQSQVRIKDRVRLYTVISPTCVLEGANKNTDKPVIKISIWKKLKGLLSSLLYS